MKMKNVAVACALMAGMTFTASSAFAAKMSNRLTVKFTSPVLWLIPHVVWHQNPARYRLILVRSQLPS